MKKYLSFFLVFVMTLMISANIAKAEYKQITALTGNTAPVNIKAPAHTDVPLPIQIRERMSTLEKLVVNKENQEGRMAMVRIRGREEALNRFDNAIQRISGLMDKVNAKITTLEEDGVSIADAKISVTNAETKLATATEKVTSMNELLATSTTKLSTTEKTELRELAQEAQALVVEARQQLIDAVKLLKDALTIKMQLPRSSFRSPPPTQEAPQETRTLDQ